MFIVCLDWVKEKLEIIFQKDVIPTGIYRIEFKRDISSV